MNFTLIDPPRYTFPLNHASNVAIPPLGIAYIAAAAEEAGHTVRVIDSVGEALDTYTQFGPVYLRGLRFQAIVDRIDPDTDVIGMGNMFSCQWPATRRLIARIKDRFPDIPIILGGEHPTGMPELSLRQAPVDVVALGEGEETLVELLAHYGGTGPAALADISGIAYLADDGCFVMNPRRTRIKDINKIAWPAWHHFNIEGYIGFNQPHGASLGRYMPMLGTRGCPYACTFCTSPQMWGRRWQMREPELIADEMQHWMQTYNVTDFHFEDLTAIVDKQKILNMCAEIESRGMNVTFQLPSGTRSEAVDTEVARALYNAGCREFQFAPESGDERVLKAIRKKVKLDRLFEAAQCAIDEDISVSCNFIFGFPEDTRESILNNYKAIMRCAKAGFTGVNLNAYSPQPNTASFKDLVASGRIQEFDDEYFMSLFTFQSFFVRKSSYNEHFTPEQVTVMIYLGMILFYGTHFALDPSRAQRTIASLFKDVSANKSATYGKSMVKELGRVLRFRMSLKNYSLDDEDTSTSRRRSGLIRRVLTRAVGAEA